MLLYSSIKDTLSSLYWLYHLQLSLLVQTSSSKTGEASLAEIFASYTASCSARNRAVVFSSCLEDNDFLESEKDKAIVFTPFVIIIYFDTRANLTLTLVIFLLRYKMNKSFQLF